MNLNFLLPKQPIFFEYFNEQGRGTGLLFAQDNFIKTIGHILIFPGK